MILNEDKKVGDNKSCSSEENSDIEFEENKENKKPIVNNWSDSDDDNGDNKEEDDEFDDKFRQGDGSGLKKGLSVYRMESIMG